MTTRAYSADVARLADILREHPLAIEPLRPAIVGVYMIELHIKSSDLRAIAAVNNGLQLAFDAASLVAGSAEPALTLELIWSGSGSLREVFILNPRTSLGREQLNYILGVGFQALTCIDGFPPVLAAALYAIFAGGMLIASAHSTDLPRLEAESVDADALAHVEVKGTLHPPGTAWRPTSGASRLAALSDYVSAHEDYVHVATIRRYDGLYNIGLIVDGDIREEGKAQALAEWFARENGLPCKDEPYGAL